MPARVTKGQCPAHRYGLRVAVTPREQGLLPRCRRTPGCPLQAGHPGGCDG
jgi:hypothetical protein